MADVPAIFGCFWEDVVLFNGYLTGYSAIAPDQAWLGWNSLLVDIAATGSLEPRPIERRYGLTQKERFALLHGVSDFTHASVNRLLHTMSHDAAIERHLARRHSPCIVLCPPSRSLPSCFRGRWSLARFQPQDAAGDHVLRICAVDHALQLGRGGPDQTVCDELRHHAIRFLARLDDDADDRRRAAGVEATSA
jgi:hypothetical protein